MTALDLRGLAFSFRTAIRGATQLALALAAALFAGHANAQAFPKSPITIVVPFSPGGLPDIVARTVATELSTELGQAVVVENVSGASGTIATSRVAKAKPDGYTLIAGVWNTHVANGAIFKSDIDLVQDFTPVGLIGGAPLVLVASAKVPADNMKELINWMKANPGKASAGTVGFGSPSNLLIDSLKRRTQTDFTMVNYRGSGAQIQDLIAGTLSFTVSNAATSLPHIKAGTMKAIAVTGDKRLAIAPEFPTISEAGFPDLEISQWVALFAPGKTPQPVVKVLNAALVKALQSPELAARVEGYGFQLAPANRQSPQALAEFQKQEIAKWWPVIKEAGIKPQ